MNPPFGGLNRPRPLAPQVPRARQRHRDHARLHLVRLVSARDGGIKPASRGGPYARAFRMYGGHMIEIVARDGTIFRVYGDNAPLTETTADSAGTTKPQRGCAP
jgi:hypothetical protein